MKKCRRGRNKNNGKSSGVTRRLYCVKRCLRVAYGTLYTLPGKVRPHCQLLIRKTSQTSDFALAWANECPQPETHEHVNGPSFHFGGGANARLLTSALLLARERIDQTSQCTWLTYAAAAEGGMTGQRGSAHNIQQGMPGRLQAPLHAPHVHDCLHAADA